MLSKQRLIAAITLSLATGATSAADGGTSFNPDISLILDGRYVDYSNDSDYELPGFMLGGEAGRPEKGFQLGHNELVFSANVDDMFYGKLTTIIADHDGETEVELEEAFIETVALGHGLGVRAGRFFSGIGYLNEQHPHAWDFTDAPLVYQGLFGNQYYDDGLQLNWVAPTDLYLKLGAEAFRGETFPAAGAANDGIGAYTLFAKIGGDVGASHAWQLGLSHWNADVEGRTSGVHAHDGGATEIPTFTGDSQINGIDFVWKWAPNGNPVQRNFKFQAEYFSRDEEGIVEMANSSPLEASSYDGTQSGWYAQAVYQFIPRWRVGLRYDQLESDNKGDDEDVLGEAGLNNEGHNPKRASVMFDYSHSEYSRIRLQYARDDSYEDSDNILYVQYLMSLGPHGAHKF